MELTQVASLEQVNLGIRFSKNLLAFIREPFFKNGGVNAAEIGVEIEIAIIFIGQARKLSNNGIL